MVAEPVADPSPLQSRSPETVADRPDPEVVERPTRRSFSVDYKLRILDEAAACAEARHVGALLRREGLYYSHLAKWRQQCAAGGRAALAQPRGRKPPEASTTELARVVLLWGWKTPLSQRLPTDSGQPVAVDRVGRKPYDLCSDRHTAVRLKTEYP